MGDKVMHLHKTKMGKDGAIYEKVGLPEELSLRGFCRDKKKWSAK
jgi:hypothetical protein